MEVFDRRPGPGTTAIVGDRRVERILASKEAEEAAGKRGLTDKHELKPYAAKCCDGRFRKSMHFV